MTVKGIVSEVPKEVSKEVPKEVPKEALFCHAIASGNLQHARELHPHVDLFKKSDLGITPALFCSWAAYQKDPQVAIDILHDYFPDLRTYPKQALNADIAHTLLSIVLPTETSSSTWVAKLLGNISSIDPDRSASDERNQKFIFTCCVAALKFILDINNGAFDGISSKTRELAQKLLQCQWLRPFSEDELTINPLRRNHEPNSLQTLMALLDDEESATEAEAHYLHLHPQRTYLISRSAHTNSVSKATKELKTCREECENENRLHQGRMLSFRPVN